MSESQEPDQIDMMTANELRRELRGLIAGNRRRCQNCGNVYIPKHRGKGMPLIICGVDPRVGWDRTREWGQTCDKWIPSNVGEIDNAPGVFTETNAGLHRTSKAQHNEKG